MVTQYLIYVYEGLIRINMWCVHNLELLKALTKCNFLGDGFWNPAVARCILSQAIFEKNEN